MFWGSWSSSVRETFPVPIWDIGSANLSLGWRIWGLSYNWYFEHQLRWCAVKVRPGLIILAVSLDLAENYQRTKPWLSLADFATWHSCHDCIWQRLFPSCCPLSVASAKPGVKEEIWGVLPGHCPGEQPTCFLPGGTRNERIICAVRSEPHILSYPKMKALWVDAI